MHQKLLLCCSGQPRSNSVCVNNACICLFAYVTDSYPTRSALQCCLILFDSPAQTTAFPTSHRPPGCLMSFPLREPLSLGTLCVCCPSPVSLNHPPLGSSCCSHPAAPMCLQHQWVWVDAIETDLCKRHPVLYESNPFDSKRLIEC